MSNQARKKIKRRYWINPGFQGRFLRMILTLVFVVLGFGVISPLFAGVIALSPSAQGGATPWVLVGGLALFAVVMSMAIAHFAIRMSHRICGPIYRVQSALEELAEGKRPSEIVLRKDDELQELARATNHLIESLFDSESGSSEGPQPVVIEDEPMREAS